MNPGYQTVWRLSEGKKPVMSRNSHSRRSRIKHSYNLGFTDKPTFKGKQNASIFYFKSAQENVEWIERSKNVIVLKNDT